jgi:hypothetical protein
MLEQDLYYPREHEPPGGQLEKVKKMDQAIGPENYFEVIWRLYGNNNGCHDRKPPSCKRTKCARAAYAVSFS